MNIFEIANQYDPKNPVDPETELLWYLQKGDEAHAAPLLDRVGMLEREAAEECLCAALANCSAELFGALLDHAPRGEYAGVWPAEAGLALSIEELESGAFRVNGTLPTIAAALGKAEHLRLLLDWGCDVNSASPDAATALADKVVIWPSGVQEQLLRGFPTAYCRSAVGCLRLESNTILYGATPLAAGVASGSASCVRLLLEREGVWLTETPSVSAALALRGKPWDTEAHRECHRLVRTRPDGSLRPLLLWAAIRHMNAAALRDELSRCAYGREELIRAALMLMNDNSRFKKTIWEMLSVLGDRDAAALRDERVRRRMAALIYCDFDGRNEPLPAVAEQALGDTVDLDESTAGAANYSAPVAEQCLKRFGENRRFIMSRDVICDPSPVTASDLRLFLRHVEFRAPSLPVGVSALTAAILRSGDVRLLRQALGRGLVPAEEPIERLLELAGKNTAARSLLLTHPRVSVPCAPAGAERDSYRELSMDEAERVLTDPALRAMASDALLLRSVDSDQWYREGPLSADGFQALNYAALCALRGETDLVLRCALRRDGGTERPNMASGSLTDERHSNLHMTLLCWAALGGQTETVRALLDAGFDPEERDMGQPSAFDGLFGELLSLSPLLCALLWERWSTAALLLARGARCDLTSHTVRRAFELIRGGDVPYADIRRELGTYLEGRRLRTICVLRSLR